MKEKTLALAETGCACGYYAELKLPAQFAAARQRAMAHYTNALCAYGIITAETLREPRGMKEKTLALAETGCACGYYTDLKLPAQFAAVRQRAMAHYTNALCAHGIITAETLALAEIGCAWGAYT